MFVLQRRSFNLIGLRWKTRVNVSISTQGQSDDSLKSLPAVVNVRVLSSSPTFWRPADSLMATIKNDVNLFKSVSKDIMHQKYTEAYIFYEQFSRRNEVREAREKVLAVQVIISTKLF